MFLGELNDLKLLEMLRWHHVGMGYLGQLVIVVDLNGCLLIPDGIDPRTENSRRLPRRDAKVPIALHTLPGCDLRCIESISYPFPFPFPSSFSIPSSVSA